MPRLTVSCFGDLTARLDRTPVTGLTNSKALALWVYVAAQGKPCPRSVLSSLFWGESGEAAARTSLRQTLRRLRQLLPGFIEAGDHVVTVPAGAAAACDLLTMYRLLDADPPAGAALLGLNVESLFAGLQLRHAPAFDDWLAHTRDDALRRTLEAMGRAAAHCRADDPQLAVALHRRCLALAPWAENHHRALMALFMDLGDAPSALAQFEACRSALAAELDVGPHPDTVALAQGIRAQAGRASAQAEDLLPAAAEVIAPGPTVAPAPVPRHTPTWPSPTLSLGREAELRRVTALLTGAHGRIVSIVGPGGVGKTHLALRAGERLHADFAGRVFFVPLVDLAPAADGDCAPMLRRRILETMDVPFVPGGEQAALAQALGAAPALLIVDNMEHLVPARGLLDALAQAAPALRILVTSRQRLGLGAEWLVRLDGLAFPADDAADEDARASPSVQLFAELARRVDARFDLQAHLPAVRRLCRRLEGFPLALLLVAQWLSILDVEAVAERIDAGVGALPAHDALLLPERHASMAAVLESSWQLLADDERSAAAALSVLQGHFSPDTAQAVAACGLELLLRLEHKSMLRRAADGMLGMHPLLRTLAADKLQATGPSAVAAGARHAAHFVTLLQRADEAFRTHGDAQPLRALGGHFSDLASALHFRMARAPWPDWAPAVAALWSLCRLHGWFRDGAAALHAALAAPGPDLDTTTRWRLWLTEAWFQLGEHAACRQETVGALHAIGEPVFERRPLAGVAAGLARVLLPAARASQPRVADELAARLHNRLAQVYFYEGRRASFVAATLRSVTLGPPAQVPSHPASAALVLAYTPLQRRAARFARQATDALAAGDCYDQAWAHEQLCLYALSRGDPATAQRHGSAGRALYRALNHHRNWGECTSLLAGARLLLGRHADAAALWQEAAEHGARVQEAATEIWGRSGVAMMAMRRGEPVDPAGLSAHVRLLDRIVDPNTELLYHGVLALALARAGQTDRVGAELEAVERVTRQASMLSIYALNGFVGAVLAACMLRAGTGALPAASPELLLRRLDQFARVLPGAQCTAWLMHAVCAEAAGRRGRALRLRRRIAGRLPPGCDMAAFEHGWTLPRA